MKAATGFRSLLEFFLPVSCLGCGGRMVPEESARGWCGRCGARLRPPPAPGCGRCQAPLGTARQPHRQCRECAHWPGELVAAGAAAAMAGPAHRLVHALKYEGWRALAPTLARRMEPVARRLVPRLEEDPADGSSGLVVVPIPTTRTRARSRGYNQAELLAREVARRLEFPVVTGALRRVEEGGTQVALDPAARRANVRHAFRSGVRGGDAALGAGRILLVDDVLTTGATIEAAARALVAGGARRVAAVTFARALPDPAPGDDLPEDPEALGELLDPVLPGAWTERPPAPGSQRSGPSGGHGDGEPPRRLH